MSETSYRDLSGLWTGVFDYEDQFGDATPFNAIVTEVAGAFCGETVEPNTFGRDRVPEIYASLGGSRNERHVSFQKVYEQRTGATHLVAYAGLANASLTRIRGTWTIDGGLSGSGPFIMNRDQQSAESGEDRVASLLCITPERD